LAKTIDHVAIAVEDLGEAVRLFEKILGRPVSRRESVAAHDVETATFELGETAIELVEGTNENSPIRRFVEKRGPGIHHVAIAVENIEAAMEDLKGKGFLFADDVPRPGKDGSRVAFLHPRSTGKILCELVEPAPKR
jgi:methylmalonyl-CoA/ethylmalonyl-CoA epimerase